MNTLTESSPVAWGEYKKKRYTMGEVPASYLLFYLRERPHLLERFPGVLDYIKEREIELARSVGEKRTKTGECILTMPPDLNILFD